MQARSGISWTILIGTTAVLTVAMRLVHLPGALLLGPMVAAIGVAVYVPGASLPRGATIVAQSILGCLIAHALSPRLLLALAPHWPVMLGMNLLVVLGILALGILTTRLRWLPGTAGIWGMSPGGAAAMVMLSEAYGSDKRLVAVMQYLRLLCAVFAVIMVGSLLGSPHVGEPAVTLPGAPGAGWFPPLQPLALLTTIGLATAAIAAATLLRKATLVIFVPIFGGIALQSAGWVAPEVPPLVSAGAFTIIGWHIGLGFTRASLLHSARLIPRIMLAIAAILLLCALLSLLFARLAHVTFLTAYMALNPGGADVVMVMAASIAVDLPLIMAMQISRLILVFAIAPFLARLAASRMSNRA